VASFDAGRFRKRRPTPSSVRPMILVDSLQIVASANEPFWLRVWTWASEAGPGALRHPSWPDSPALGAINPPGWNHRPSLPLPRTPAGRWRRTKRNRQIDLVARQPHAFSVVHEVQHLGRHFRGVSASTRDDPPPGCGGLEGGDMSGSLKGASKAAWDRTWWQGNGVSY